MGTEILYRILCLVMGYAFGLFQTAYIIGKIHHIDIRKYGSGNSGATNALRVLGKRAGIEVYLGDCLKCVIACLITRLVFRSWGCVRTCISVLYGISGRKGNLCHIRCGNQSAGLTNYYSLSDCICTGSCNQQICITGFHYTYASDVGNVYGICPD